MFIETIASGRRPPSGGPCRSEHLAFTVDMALLCECQASSFEEAIVFLFSKI